MNVRPPSDALPVSAAGPVQADAAGPDRAGARPAPPAPGAGDRVELSAAARTLSASAARTEPLEMEVARLALRSDAKLPPARLHELRERVRTGYYDTPTAVDRIAEGVVRDLVGRGA